MREVILDEDHNNVLIELGNEHNRDHAAARNVTTAHLIVRYRSAGDTGASDGAPADGGSSRPDERPSGRLLLPGWCAEPDEHGRVHGLYDDTERLAGPLAIRMTRALREA